jgi:uncharacterized protein YecT (DUF1311 family)
VRQRAGSAAVVLAAALMWQMAPPAAAATPSFSCTGSLNATERTICSDDSLAILDRQVATAYKNKFDGLPVESANALDELVKSLAITQKAWLAHRNLCGTDVGCIYKAYVTRRAALMVGNSGRDVPCRDVVGAAQAAIYVKDCVAVASETHPPCNAENSCELIISHNIFRCAGLGDGAPKFCSAYSKPGN